MSDIMDKMKKIGSIKSSDVLSHSKFFNNKDMVTTSSPALNIALSGSIDGGLTPGLTFLAGPSRTFKTCMGLKMVAAYLNKYPESMCIFYDSEFGVTPEYLTQMGVDTERVLHVPIEDVEQFKFDIMQKLKEVVLGDKIIFFVDSIGNLASKKEVDDALSGNTAADMTRSKQMKSCFRMITPHLTTKDIPMIAVNHTYSTMELYSKQVMSGGTGPMYSANTVFIISRAQEKDKDNELEGFTFTINIEKSRFVKEKAKIPLTVRFEDGIDRYSGILDIALEGGFIIQPTKQTYQLTSNQKLPAVKKKNVEPLLDEVLKDAKFAKYIENKYKMTGIQQITTKKDEEDDE